MKLKYTAHWKGPNGELRTTFGSLSYEEVKKTVSEKEGEPKSIDHIPFTLDAVEFEEIE